MGKDTAKRRVATVAAGVATIPLASEVLAFSNPVPKAGVNGVNDQHLVSPGSTKFPQPVEPQKAVGPGACGASSASVLTGVAAAIGIHKRKSNTTGTSRLSTQTVLEKATTDAPAKILERYVKERGGVRVLRKILVANNGMAATKAILSLRQWSYLELGSDNVFEFVVMATPEDLEANAEFIRLANSYVEVPGGKNVNNYANVDLIVDVAKSQGRVFLKSILTRKRYTHSHSKASLQGVDAVWPGWGHASENPKLPDELKPLGITFIGPTSPVMSVLGDKIAAPWLCESLVT